MPGSSSTMRMREDLIPWNRHQPASPSDKRRCRDRRRRLFVRNRNRDLHLEPCAAWFIVLDTNVRVVLRQNMADNRKAQARSTPLGREPGEKQFLFLLSRNT